MNLWRVQNRCYEMLEMVYPLMREESSETDAAEWVERFRALARKLGVRVE